MFLHWRFRLAHLHKAKNDDDNNNIIITSDLFTYTKKDDSGKADNVSIATDLFVDPEPAKKKADAGNSRAYTLTRLKKERPDLFDRVCANAKTNNNSETVGG